MKYVLDVGNHLRCVSKKIKNVYYIDGNILKMYKRGSSTILRNYLIEEKNVKYLIGKTDIKNLELCMCFSFIMHSITALLLVCNIDSNIIVKIVGISLLPGAIYFLSIVQKIAEGNYLYRKYYSQPNQIT